MNLNIKIDAIVRRHYDEAPIPGLAITVHRGSERLFHSGYGVASLETRKRVTTSTVFSIASLTKQFVAASVVKLAQSGRLSLDDGLSLWFPEAFGRWNSVTVRDLLCHLSGISDSPYDSVNDEKEYSEEDLVSLISSQPLIREPGTKFEYCNSGYVLLGALIQRSTGDFYGDFLSEQLFFPLGMKQAQVYDPSLSNFATGYESDGDLINVEGPMSLSLCTPADGGLCMSLEDLSTWCNCLCSKDHTFRPIFEECWKPSVLRDGKLAGYSALRVGMGWMIPHVPTLPGLVQHEGAFRGFTSYIGALPNQNLAVAILTNIDDDVSHPKGIGQEVLAMLKIA